MEPIPRCARCQEPTIQGDGFGLCPRCLLQEALELPPEALGPDPGWEDQVDRDRNPGAPVRFGDYELLEEVARGGMGIVYRARQRSLGRIVALKVLLAGAFSGPEGRQRLRTEAAAAARLEHAGIVPVYEAGTWEGQPFYSMEFIEGRTLADAIRARSLSPSKAAQYVAQLAETIHYAHQRGVLHRDLKPSNILIDARDQPRIADFGLARVLDAGTGTEGRAGGLTLPGQVLGSPAYMPPEQAAGRVPDADTGPAGDVYSLGAVLYEAITGMPPFQGESPAEVLARVRSEDPVPPRRLVRGVPVDLETVCLRCLEKSPHRRYHSAGELAEELHRFLRGEPVRASPVGRVGHAWRWMRRNPAIALLGMAAVGLLLSIALVSVLAGVRVRASRDEARARLAESLLSEARAVRTAGEAGHRNTVLQLVERARELDTAGRLRLRQRHEATAALARTDERLVTLTNFPAGVDAMLVCLDPHFEACALWEEPAKSFVLRSVPDADLLARFSAPRADEIVAVSSDRRFVALRHGDRISVWEAASGREVLEREASEGSGGLPGGAFGPGARWFGRGERGGHFALHEWDEAASEARKTRDWPLPRGARVGSVAWSPEGDWVVLTTHDRGLAVCASDTGRPRWELPPGRAPFLGVAWNGPREWVAALAEGDRLLVFDAATGEEVYRLQTPTDASARVAFTAAGDRLAVSTERFGTRLVDSWTGSRLRDNPAPSWHLLFDRAGLRLGTLFSDGRPAWREWLPSEVLSSLGAAPSGNNQVLEFSPDGNRVCTLSAQGPRVADVEGRAVPASLPLPGAEYATFDLVPSRLLVCRGAEAWSLPWGEGAGTDEGRIVARGAGFWGAAVSRSTGRIALADHRGNSIHLLDAQYRPWRVLGPVELPGYVAFSPDGRWLTAVGGRDLWVWDLESPNPAPRRFEGGEPTPRFSPDGRWLLTLGRELRLRRVGTWEPGEPLPEDGPPTGFRVAAFSPDGRWLAVTHREREVHWLDFPSRRLVSVLEGPGEGRILDLAFSPDGGRLAVARERGEVQVWKVEALRRELRARDLDWE
jgi:WD40 repeat protein/predicted Ser/Thr protein kinase